MPVLAAFFYLGIVNLTSKTVIRGINANQLGPTTATTLGWFDFVIPNGYQPQSGLQLIIDCQVIQTGAALLDQQFTWIAAFAATADGGSIFFPPLGTARNAVVLAPGESYRPNSKLVMYCQNVDIGNGAYNYNLPTFPMTTIPQTIQIPIVGKSQCNWNSINFPLLAVSGGGIAIDGSAFVGGIPGLGYFRANAGGYFGLAPWAGGVAQTGAALPSSGLPNATGIPHNFDAYKIGDTISIGIYAFCAGNNPGGTLLHSQINSVKIQAGNVTTDLPITDMKVGWGAANLFPINYSQQRIIDHNPSTARAPDFWLETTGTTSNPEVIGPALIPLPDPAYASSSYLAFYPWKKG